MRDTFSIWFSDYDAKPSLLYRSAMTLRDEAWEPRASIENAKWWVLYQPDQRTKQDIMARYTAVETDRPIIVILEDEGRSEFHKSWAVLRMPLNYVLFFQWLDGLMLKIQQGGAASLTHDFSDDEKADHTSAYALPEENAWLYHRFRLTSWPNVARFGDDMKIVLYCSKMVRGYCSFNQLIRLGISDEQLTNILAFSDAQGFIDYELADNTPANRRAPTTTNTKSNFPNNPTEKPLETSTPSDAHSQSANIDHPLDDPEESVIVATSETDEEIRGEKNARGMLLFDAIYKMKNLFKR